MKTLTALIAFFVLAVPAQAAAPSNAKLQREIVALSTQTKALRAQVQSLQIELRAEEQKQRDTTVCFYAIGEDHINSVWHSLNVIAQYLGFTPSADFPRYDDGGACQRIGITR